MHHIKLQWDNHIHVVQLVHEATSTKLDILFISLSKIEYLQSHGSSMASWPYHKTLRREPLATKQSPYPYNQLIKDLTSPLGTRWMLIMT